MDSTQKSFMQKLLDGEVRLVVTYWVFGILALIPQMLFIILMGKLGIASYKIGILFTCGYSIFITMAIFRSAGKYEGWKVWKVLAMIHATFGILMNIMNTINVMNM